MARESGKELELVGPLPGTDPAPQSGQVVVGYDLFYGSGGHIGPFWGMAAVKQWVRQQWQSGRESEVHVHRRCAEGLGGYWYIGTYRLRRNGERIWPRPQAEWSIGRDRYWNRKG